MYMYEYRSIQSFQQMWVEERYRDVIDQSMKKPMITAEDT